MLNQPLFPQQNMINNMPPPLGQLYPQPNLNNQMYYQDNQQQARNQNIERMVEQTLNRHGFNIGISDRMLFASSFPLEV